MNYAQESTHNVDVNLIQRWINTKSPEDGKKFVNEIVSDLLNLPDLSPQDITNIQELMNNFSSLISEENKKLATDKKFKAFAEYMPKNGRNTSKINLFNTGKGNKTRIFYSV